jgi:hypothetical protein
MLELISRKIDRLEAYPTERIWTGYFGDDICHTGM